MNTPKPFRGVFKNGERLRDWKERLVPLMRFIPLSANTLTLSRGILLNVLNVVMLSGFIPNWFIWIFIGGWLTDFFDGLKARWQRLYGQPLPPTNSRFKLWWRNNAGKYLDPAVDILTSLFTAYALSRHYEHSDLVVWLFVLGLIRGLVYGYHAWEAWHHKTDRTVPPNLPSQYKTWFLAGSFSLVIISQSADVIAWAERLLGAGLVLEFFGIILLAKTCQKKRQTWRV